MKRRARLLLLFALLALATALFMLTPARLTGSAEVPSMPDDLDAYLERKESAAPYPLIPGTEKRIRWQQVGVRSELSIVYLHGFSASRRELSPTIEIVADALGANLFETRLSGHGRASGALVGVKAEDWLADAREALAVGHAIGDRVIVVGTSTGGSLAAAMLAHPLMQSASHLVLVSPNFALTDWRSRLLTGPAGPQLAEMMVGPVRSFETRSAAHAKYWSSTYPTAAVVEMMRLVNYANRQLPARTDAGVLLLLSSEDSIVSPEASLAALEKIDAARKQVVEINDSDDAMSHVLAGDILSPSTTAAVAAHIIEFVKSSQSAPRAMR